jgi:hypothetical protein
MDINNLTQEDFIQMAKYVHSMELRLEECKANALALVTQRNNAYTQVEQLKIQLNATINPQPKVVKLDSIDLINPEQYRDKKQF